MELEKEEVLYCHICGELTDFCCEDCELPVCEDCLTPFTQYGGVEYNQCQSCET